MNCSGDRAVCVTVERTRRILNNLDWKTTAEDVIQRLRPRSGPQMLVESWRGCLRRIEKDEYICQLLEEWGEEARHVQLLLMSSHSLPGYRLAKRGLDKVQIYRAQGHGKVASNKKRFLSPMATPRRNIMREIARLIGKAEAARERLSAVQELHTLADTTLLEPPSFDLSPSEEEEWVALQEQLAEEETETRELEQRKRELGEKIDTQSDEISKVKHRKAELQRKLLLEQDKQRRLSSGENRELEEAQAQVRQLQSELKIRMKLNHFQSTKIEELAALISTNEQEIETKQKL